jgi:hypothetical protein
LVDRMAWNAAACMGHRDRYDSQRHMVSEGFFPAL